MWRGSMTCDVARIVAQGTRLGAIHCLLWPGAASCPGAATPGKADARGRVYSAYLHLNISAANIRNAGRKMLFKYK